MAPVLVSVSTLLGHVGEPEGDAGAAEQLLVAVEARLAAECGRADWPFAEAASGRVEVRDGTGTGTLYLHYPIATLTSVVLGYDPDTPDEMLDVDDPEVLLWRAGARRLVRRSGVFGGRGTPDYVHVTYATQDDLPELASRAVLEMAAGLWAQAGAEGITAERVGAWSADYGTLANQLPNWRAAIRAYGVLV